MTDRNLTKPSQDDHRIVAVGLLTKRDLALLGDRFDRAFPVHSEDEDFADLLRAIDAADRRRRPPGV